jgi:hypothetical protein
MAMMRAILKWAVDEWREKGLKEEGKKKERGKRKVSYSGVAAAAAGTKGRK